MNKTPHFIIAGAPKCGTTALANILNDHEGISMSSIKEPRFFTRLKGDMEKAITGDGPRQGGTYSKGFTWYSDLWKASKPGQILGEASTVYFGNHDSAELINSHLPNVKIILMLREPVARTYSHYWQEQKLGFDFPDFDQMLKENHPRFRYFVQVSRYGQHLERFKAIFPKERLMVIDHKAFSQDPKTHFKYLANFLGIDFLPFEQMDLGKRYNEQFDVENRSLMRTITKAQNSTLAKMLPQSLRSLLGKFRQKAVQGIATQIDIPPISPFAKAQLENILADDITVYKSLSLNNEK